MTSAHLNFSGGSRPSDKGGPGNPDPEIRGKVRSQKNFFPHFGPQFGLKIRGGPGSPGPSPGSTLELINHFVVSHFLSAKVSPEQGCPLNRYRFHSIKQTSL